MTQILTGRMESIAEIGKKTHIAMLTLYCVSLVSLAIQAAATFMHTPVIWSLLVIVAAFAIMAAIALRREWLGRKEVYRYGLYWTMADKNGNAPF